MKAWIRSLPWPMQVAAWIVYGPLWLVWSILTWATGELWGQAKSKSKKTLAPLLWPLVGIGILLLLMAVNPEGARVLLGYGLLFAIMAIGFRKILSGFWPTKSKK